MFGLDRTVHEDIDRLLDAPRAAQDLLDGLGNGHVDLLGAGEARVFMDGVERAAKWRKPATESPLRFYDASGTELRLNAGPVWIVALPSLKNLTVE